MRKTVLVFALLASTIVSAAEFSRCGKDQFGNIVCLDKDGVLSNQSRSSADTGKGIAASGVSAAEATASRDAIDERLRCGIDPFGNKVCR
jgi:hypothetical protein